MVSYSKALPLARLLPKSELHLHLDGSLLPSFLFSAAEKLGHSDLLPSNESSLRSMIDEMKFAMRSGGSGGHKNIEGGKNWPVFDLVSF